MKLGAERKKLMFLGGLVVVAGAIYLWPSTDERQEAAAATKAARPAASRPTADSVVPDVPQAESKPARRGAQAGRSSQEFRPKVGHDQIPPDKVDPTINFALLEKVRAQKPAGGERSLFDFGAAPVVALPLVAKIKVEDLGRKVPNISQVPLGPLPAPPPPPPPPPPPITLKFYGFVNPRAGSKRAFFLDGDDIFIAAEGEVVKRHYRIVRISTNSAVVEDTENKNQQTLPLEEQAG